MIEFLVGVGLVCRVIFDIFLLAAACMLLYALSRKDKGRFEIGDLISTPGGADNPGYWYKVKRVDRANQEYLLETQERTTFIMTFEQAKEQCEIIECNPNLMSLWNRNY